MRSGAKLVAIALCLMMLAGGFAAIPAGAQESSRMPAGNTDTRIVLAELFTATWCGPCFYADSAWDNIMNDPTYFDSRVVLIEYHTSDSFTPADGSATPRSNYYSVSGIPTTVIDGTQKVVGASSTSGAQSSYESKIDGRPQTADVFLDIDTAFKSNQSQLTVWANATLLKDTNKNNLKLHAMLIEDEDILFPSNGKQYPIRMTGRDEVFSTSVQMSSKGDTGRATGTISLDPVWNIADMAVIAYLQADSDKEVMQAGINYFSGNQGPIVSGSAPSVVMDEDTQDNSLDMDTFFTDPEGDPIDYWFVQGSQHIAATSDSGHVVTLTPDPEWSGTENIILQAADSSNCPTEISVQVTVNAVNDPPQALNGLPNINLVEGQSKDAFNLYDYFDDVDDLVLTFTATGQDKVDVNIKSSGLVVMTAPMGWSGDELVTFKIEDPAGAYIEDDSLVTVADKNFPPVQDLKVANLVMDEDTVDASIDFDDHFSDVDGDVLQYTISGNLMLDAVVDMDNILTLTPTQDWSGEEELTVTVSDGTNTPLTDVFYVTVTAVNDPPTLTTSEFEDVVFEEDGSYTTLASVNVLFTDVDGDNLVYSLIGGDENLDIVLNQDLTVSFEPVRNWFGTMTYTLSATDGPESVDYTANVEVTSVNDPVYIDTQSPISNNIDIRENDNVDFSVIAGDDDGTAINYVWSLDGSVVSAESDSYTLVTDYNDAGTHTVTIKASDDETEAAVTWTVRVKDLNRNPTVSLVSPVSDAQFDAGDTISYSAEAADEDGDTLTYKWTLDGRQIGDSAEFTDTATKGTHTIKVTVMDGKGGQSEAVINIEVKGDDTKTLTPTTDGSLLGTSMIALIVIVIVVIVIVLMVALRMRRPKNGTGTEAPMQDGTPQPPSDPWAQAGYNQGGYNQGGYDQGGYDQGGYDQGYDPGQSYQPYEQQPPTQY